MSRKDHNGLRIKPGHDGSKGLPFGEMVWILVRNDDKFWGVWESRHDAIAARTLYLERTNKRKWIEPMQVPAGSVRLKDMSTPK